MASAAPSIPPLAPPPPIGAAGVRAVRNRLQRPSLRVVSRRPEPAQRAIAPAPALPQRISELRPAAPVAPRANADASALTFVIFRADGGAAKTIRLSLAKLALAAVLLTCALAGALSLGWTIGEWTARF
jgi:hypothetical protein